MCCVNTSKALRTHKHVLFHLPETCWKLSGPNAGAPRTHNAVILTSRKMNVSPRWIQLSSLVQSLNVKQPFWPLWAQHFTILAHAKECTMMIYWSATSFMTYSIIDHTSVSRILIYTTGLFISACVYWKPFKTILCVFQWLLGKAAVVPPNLLTSTSLSTVTHGYMVNFHAVWGYMATLNCP